MENKGIDIKNYDWLRRLRYFISLVSTILMLLQITLPVVAVAESLGESESQITESMESMENTGSESMEAPVVIEPVVEEPPEVPPVAESSPEAEAPPEEAPEPTLMDFSVSVIWQDGNNIDGLRPGSLIVYRLDNYAYNNVAATLSSDNQWTYTWHGIRDDISYTIDALSLPEGYTSTVDQSNPRHVVVTNHYTPKPRESTTQEVQSEEVTQEESKESTETSESSDEDPDPDSDMTTEEESQEEVTEPEEESSETTEEVQSPDEDPRLKEEDSKEEDKSLDDTLIGPLNIAPPEDDEAITVNFYLNQGDPTPFQTQIILDGESLVKPESPSGLGNFLGWYAMVGGTEIAVPFGTPITVDSSSPDTISVYGKYENSHYVEFLQRGVVIMTKVVQDGDLVNTNGVPVIEDFDGKVLSHWSLVPDGPAFDFSQPITEDLALHAVGVTRHKINFNTNGGDSQLPIFVEDGDVIDTSLINATREGYTLSHWALPNGNPFNLNTTITQNYDLTAVWTPASQSYTVVYWHENPNDNGYSFKEAVERNGTTGSNATFIQRSYNHFTYSHADQNVEILSDGSTQINVYYSRDTYRLRFRTGGSNNTVFIDVQVKHGASILTHWDNAVSQYPNVNWRDSSNNYIQIEAPIMPQSNLTLQAVDVGSIEGTINFVEIGNGQIFKTVEFYVVNGQTFNGGREVVGFTWEYVTQEGQGSDTFRWQNGYTIETYYTRNEYNIEFITNNPYDSQVRYVNNIPYEADLTDKRLPEYQLDETTMIYNGVTYTFVGWWDNEAFGGPMYPFTGNQMPAHNLVMYAKWEPTDFTVINHFGDGINSKEIIVEPGELIDSTQLEMVDRDDVFSGWYWFLNGRYVQFDLTMPIKQDGIEIYPEWVDGNDVSIVYNANGGNDPLVDSNSYKIGVEATTKTKESMTNDGRQFIGWNTAADGSGTSYDPREIFELSPNLIQSGIITLYAQWSELDSTTLTYDPNGGLGSPFVFDSILNNSVQTVVGAANADFTFTRPNHEFIGWNTAADGSGTSYSVGNNIRVNNADPAGNVLYAQWVEKIQVTVNKVWEDGDNQDGTRPQSVLVKLWGDGSPVGEHVTLTSVGNWSYTWNNLPKTNNGVEINYEVEELNVPDSYTSTVSNVGNVFTLTNSYTPQTKSISGTKSWNDGDDQDGMRPDSVTIRLFANNVEVDSLVVSEADDWAYSFTNLPVFAAGVPITYTITEDNVPGYSSTRSGYNVINNRTPDEVSISVFKSWIDGDNQDGLRPESIQVQLLADGAASGDVVTLTSATGWTYTWSGLPENAGGTAIDYSVEELNVPTGYASVVTDNNDGNLLITNSYTPETTFINGTKTWNDGDDQDGIRPDSVTIRLFANNVEVDSLVVSEADDWAYSFTNLPVFENGSRITYTITEDNAPGYSSVRSGYDVTNNRTPDEVSINVFKTWLDGNDQDGLRPESIQVQLLADGSAEGAPITLTSTGGWTYTWSGLPENDNGVAIDYSVIELNVPDGYTSTVTDNNDGNLMITNSYTPETTSINGTKFWDDNDNQDGVRPDSVTVRLFADNVEVASQVVTEADDWAYSFTNLPVFANGSRITYAITEDNVPDYTMDVDGFDIFNRHTPDEVSISVFKSWLDSNNQDGIRPETILVQLLADGSAEGAPITLTSTGGWTYTWSGLPENDNGVAIDYSVEELNVPDGYTSIVTDNNDGNLLITNSYTPETTSINGMKFWNDVDNQDGVRPDSVTIRLFADNVEVASQVVTEADDWEYSFTNLPVFANGSRITYTITEDNVLGYSSSNDGFNVINNRTPDEVSISVFKSWLDSNDQDGLRPESIQVQLTADGVATGDVITLTSTGGWTYTWSGLPENDNGVAIDYSVIELNVPDGYTSIVTDNNDGNLLITNSYNPETRSIDGTKFWDDNDDQDGVRPDSVTVRLLADNVPIDSRVVNAANNWAYSFTNLPVYANGEEITYTVTEDNVPDYTMDVDGFDIFNRHTPDEVSISVFKSWLDSQNQDGKRPQSVQVQLTADGVATGDVVTLTSTGGWTYTWDGLPVNANGVAIDYSVIELNVPNGYTSIVTDDDDGNLLMTNSYTPETTSINGAKFWDDNDDQDGVRPDSVTVRLLADNVPINSHVVNAANNWAYSFTNLPVYANGEEITYTVTEDNVPDYTMDVDGFDIFNRHTPDEVSISVFKSWLDSNDQDGLRPESIRVQLFGDDVEVGTPVTLTSTGGWTYTWTGLPENDNGQPIDYTVEELDVPVGYTSIVTDNNDGNLLITNSYNPETTTIEGMKFWNDNDDQDGIRPDSVTIKLFGNNVEVGRREVTAADDWSYSFTNLPVFANGTRIIYTITEDYVPGYSSTTDGFDVFNNRTPDEVSISVFKSWLDSNDQDGLRPESIRVQLFGDDVEVGTPVTLTSTGGWTYTWTDLPENDNGVAIDYSVEELDVPVGYTSIVTDNNDGNLLITNSYNPETTTIEGVKFWNDNDDQDGIRPDSVTIKLFGNNVEVGRREVTAADDWSYSFTNLPVFANGTRIIYTVTEDYVPGYSSTTDGFDVFNNRTPDEVSISVFKSWLDSNDQDGARPDNVEVRLLVNGLAVDEVVTLTQADGWTHTWAGLPLNDNGVAIDYSVEELNVPEGYTSIVTDNDDGNLLITNSYTPETTSIEGTKSWDDNDNQDGVRPESITVILMANNVQVMSRVVTAEDDWSYSFTNLPVFQAGDQITYAVTEDHVPGYSMAVDGFDIFNRRTPEEVSISVFKSWLDRNNLDGLRPNSVEVQLLADGVATGEVVTLTLAGGWMHTWAGLPLNDNGVAIDYSVEELNVPAGYTSIVTDNDDGNLLITNTYVPSLSSIRGEKIWQDDYDNQFNTRPESITVQLLRDGEVVDTQVVTPNEAGRWLYAFNNLERSDSEGNRYVYTIDEVSVPNYTTTIDGRTIYNRYNVPLLVTIAGDKIWDDGNDKLGMRPESITVNLVVNGQVIDSQVVREDEAGEWKYFFTGLPMYNEAGVAILYTISEESVPGYETIYDGIDIINKLKVVEEEDPETPVDPPTDPEKPEAPSTLPATGEYAGSWLWSMSLLLIGLLVIVSEGRLLKEEEDSE